MDGKFKKVRGMEDVLPNHSSIWQRIEDTSRNVFSKYNFKEIRTPMVEKTEVFTRSSGDSSDIVSKQMYSFDDKGGRNITLRPEGTAGIVRSFVENKLFGPEHQKPVKLFYMGSMYRYERPGATHNREFHQIGCETIGAISPQIDAEVISLALNIFKELDVKNMKVEINTLGDEESRVNYTEALVNYFKQYEDELSEDSKRRLDQNPLRILDSKDKNDQKLVANAPKIQDSLNERSKDYFNSVLSSLDALGIDYVIDQKLVRGLDYYTDTVFEIMTENESFGEGETTICAGGRYNNMVEQFGGPENTGGFGFAFGEERAVALLNSKIEDDQIDYFIVTDIKDKESSEKNDILQKALKTADELRADGNIVEVNYQERSVKSQEKAAKKFNAQNILKY